jgi:hypothetical protein
LCRGFLGSVQPVKGTKIGHAEGTNVERQPYAQRFRRRKIALTCGFTVCVVISPAPEDLSLSFPQ